MLDVAQNTARLNSLIAQYYTAESQLESKTESKLALSREASQNTIANNNKSLDLITQYEQMEKDLTSGSGTTIGGVAVSYDSENGGANYFKTVNEFTTAWEKQHGTIDQFDVKEAGGTGKYVKVDENSAGYTISDIVKDDKGNVYSQAVAEENAKPGAQDPGTEPTVPAEPNENDYKNEDGTEKTVNGKTYQEAHRDYETKKKEHEDWEKKNTAHQQWKSEYNTNVQARAEDLAVSVQKGLIIDKNKEITEEANKARDAYKENRDNAREAFKAGQKYINDEKDALSTAKQTQQKKQDLKFQNDQEALSQKESMLDQEIQALQAEVTALKTEIDSLKQERNSNVQSDFKLFG